VYIQTSLVFILSANDTKLTLLGYRAPCDDILVRWVLCDISNMKRTLQLKRVERRGYSSW